ncbi:Nonribosomal peptide synthetase 12 [Colletotrichum gloeosporioides]|uniref:Nonribosomal peptide synthetase 12 n=1 Tax=Colletotrichum gloeosporioides TaxID=474922 RepID=A0A8H4CDL3_COLGL|nr:Nonribosomal peptide synthetase 12 [Colletotrichum gloeosporioides]KAF3802065.1 Nonribosomal peptide synthetase 12 [Colletotrichum gloeosporioides]
MASDFAKTSLPGDVVNDVLNLCARQNVSEETFFITAWSYTIAIYNAASLVTTNVIIDGKQNKFVTDFGSGMTILEACSALHCTKICSDTDSEHSPHSSTRGGELHDDPSTILFAQNGTFDLDSEIGKQGVLPSIVIDVQHRIALHYIPHFVSALSADAFLETFTTIIGQFATLPHDKLLGEVNVLGPLNRERLESWSPCYIPAVERCVHDYVDEHASNTPWKEAVVASEGPIFTYSQLSTLSSRLARYLINNGINKGDIIPILFEKSSFAVLAIVAILKAGGAYVGFSAETPINFLRECSSIANAPLIITSNHHEDLVRKVSSRALVLGQAFVEGLENSTDDERFSSPARPSDLAYLVFTSGSTGTPKAVMTEHRAYVTDALAQQKAALLNPSSRVLHFASYNFDATNFDVLTTLIAGGTICVPTEFDRINRLAGAINYLGANFLGVTATLAHILDPEDVPGLKTVILCGEANSPETVEKWTRSGADVINGYGPSEASCAFSYNIYTRQSPRANNIGRALDGACWGWVVNPENHNQLLPIGAKGELLIQGPTLSRGYLNEPEKTAKKFIESPEWLPGKVTISMQRLYKTGDLVRQLPDQSFEVFGRIDTQVKLNGQRIELGEIEHKVSLLLGGDCTVAVEAVHLTGGEETASKVLIAFYAMNVGGNGKDATPLDIVNDSESELIDVQSIKKKLANDLKAIAIPQAFIPLLKMPVTSQGKLDRKCLQKIGSQLDKPRLAAFSGVTFRVEDEPPMDDFETILCELFAQSLGLSKHEICRQSDFSSMGGDSLKAIKLVSLARKLGFSLSVPDILQTPRLFQLADFLRRSTQNHESRCSYQPFSNIASRTTLDEIQKIAMNASVSPEIEDIVQATDLQASCVAFSTFSEERRGINWLICDFDEPHNEIASDSTLRTFFVPHRRTLYQAVSKSFRPPTRAHLNLDNIEHATNTLIENDFKDRQVEMTCPQTAFELLSIHDSTKIQRLLIRISAAQYDGHSVSILSREMRSLLNGCQLPELKGSYQAYLHYARTIELDEGIEYWRSLLHGAEMTQLVSHKGSSHDVPSGLNFVDGVLLSMIDSRLLESCCIGARSSNTFGGNTKGAIVKTAWALTLAELTGKDDVVFGSTGWGRNHSVEFAEDVMGSCTSHIPTRLRITTSATGNSPRVTYGDLVEQLQTQHIASMRYENIGANTIVEKCTAWKRWTRFSSLLVFQGLDIGTPQTCSEDGEVASTMRFIEIMDPGDRADVIVHVEPFGDQTRVMMAFAKACLPEDVAGVMMSTFKQYLKLVTQFPDQPVPLDKGDLSPLLPIICESAAIRRTLDVVISSWAEDAVKEVWMKVLDVDDGEFGMMREGSRSFLEVWGNSVSAAALAHEYRSRGFAVSTEDMLRHQMAFEQMQMVSMMIDGK